MAPIVRKLGRKKPLSQYDHGDFRAVRGSDGTTRYFPRMKAHYNRARDVQPPPASVDWSTKAAAAIAQMDDNDTLGCCVIASRHHRVGVLTGAATGAPVLSQGDEVVRDYSAACGYPPDNGCDMSAVNQYEQETGVLLSGARHKIAGSASVDHTNQNLVMVCLDLFGTLNVGLNLPGTWYQSADGSDWAPVPGDPIVGGHEVQAFGYDPSGVWVATWGGRRRILWAAFAATDWIDELYTSLAPDWTANADLAPNGIDAATLTAALAAVANGQVPPLPGPAPGPVPPPAPGPAPAPFSGTVGLAGYTATFADGLLVATTIPAAGRRAGAIDWSGLLALVERYGAVALPIVLADYAAGKSWAQIVADVVAAVLTPASARPCRGGC